MKQRIYVEGFKEKVLGRSDDQSIRSIAADLGMNMGTLRGWMKRALRDQENPSGKTIPSADCACLHTPIYLRGHKFSFRERTPTARAPR